MVVRASNKNEKTEGVEVHIYRFQALCVELLASEISRQEVPFSAPLPQVWMYRGVEKRAGHLHHAIF
ncbi:hypothetical protein TNIN_311831 [Trichonephila inaurata madagascariensis]|uniref:Uncharacterized protein n=1 Tax=Trichonephila inaurata madagascariensis TaxID=2747483 RepID=A0A8X6YMP5_9ARAC|nr:hypothetical protein TNIN_311831 [Trichonephila inaurata madagascariensis]